MNGVCLLSNELIFFNMAVVDVGSGLLGITEPVLSA